MKKRFDSDTNIKKVTTIDCLECEHYYTGACDAQAGGCDAYTPTRKITMAEDIKTIKKRQNAMYTLLISMFCILCAIAVAVI